MDELGYLHGRQELEPVDIVPCVGLRILNVNTLDVSGP